MRNTRKKGRGPKIQQHIRRQPSRTTKTHDAQMKDAQVVQGISKRRNTQRKNPNKHRDKANSAPARLKKTFEQAANNIETDFLREGKKNLNRLFYSKTKKEKMNYDDYESLKIEIGLEYAKIQSQQQKEIFRLSRELKIVEKTKDELISKIYNLQDQLDRDENNSHVDDIVSVFNKL
jgi:hypothetical protein